MRCSCYLQIKVVFMEILEHFQWVPYLTKTTLVKDSIRGRKKEYLFSKKQLYKDPLIS